MPFEPGCDDVRQGELLGVAKVSTCGLVMGIRGKIKEIRLRKVKTVVCGTARASQAGENCRCDSELEAGVGAMLRRGGEGVSAGVGLTLIATALRSLFASVIQTLSLTPAGPPCV